MPEVQPEEESQAVEQAPETEAVTATDAPEAEVESLDSPDASVAEGETASEGSEDGAAKAAPEEEDDGRRRRPWPRPRLEAALEAMLFASPDVLGFRQMRSILPDEQVSNEAIREALAALRERYDEPGHGVQLVEISGGWQLQTRPEHFDFVGALAKTRTEEKITPAALETLALIAYKQPITRAEIDAIRGVGSGQIIRTLMDKNMVKVVGRVELPGRPFQYGTTKHFLDHFGLKNLKDLPRGNKDL